MFVAMHYHVQDAPIEVRELEGILSSMPSFYRGKTEKYKDKW
jgi:hypothetical protein